MLAEVSWFVLTWLASPIAASLPSDIHQFTSLLSDDSFDLAPTSRVFNSILIIVQPRNRRVIHGMRLKGIDDRIQQYTTPLPWTFQERIVSWRITVVRYRFTLFRYCRADRTTTLSNLAALKWWIVRYRTIWERVKKKKTRLMKSTPYWISRSQLSWRKKWARMRHAPVHCIW